MLLLALDTSSAVGVALLDDERLLAVEQHHDPRRHGELLAPAVRSVLAAAGVDRRDLGAVAVGVGPAPFTGLRVGIATALVLGEALGVPVHGVGSLDALAATALAAGRGALAGGFVVAADARRREVHWARIAVQDPSDALSGWSREAGPDVAAPDDVPTLGLPAVGRGAALHRAELPGPDTASSTAGGVGGFDTDAAALPLDPDPGVLGALVARRLAAGGELLEPSPLYLRRPDAVVPAALR